MWTATAAHPVTRVNRHECRLLLSWLEVSGREEGFYVGRATGCWTALGLTKTEGFRQGASKTTIELSHILIFVLLLSSSSYLEDDLLLEASSS